MTQVVAPRPEESSGEDKLRNVPKNQKDINTRGDNTKSIMKNCKANTREKEYREEEQKNKVQRIKGDSTRKQIIQIEEPSKEHNETRCRTDSIKANTEPKPKIVYKEITLTQWIIFKIRRLFSINKKKDQDFEDLELAPTRYRPVKLEKLCQSTRFTKEELQFIYRGFKQECPTGVISEETFREIYCKFFPIGNLTEDGTGRNSGMYAHYIFGTMDPEGTGQITFADFISGLSILLKGTLQERVTWAFNLYDINNDGYITREELVDIVTSVYDLLGEEANPEIEDSTTMDHVEKLFDKLDLNKDGVVTMDEFMEYCSKNENIVSTLNSFDSI